MTDEKQFTDFDHLIKKGDVIAVERFIDSGADPNLHNRFHWTPLMLAASKGHSPIVRLLLVKGADVNAVNDFGVSALAYAALRGNAKCVRALLDAGARVDVRPNGWSLLQCALYGERQDKNSEYFQMLQQAGAV